MINFLKKLFKLEREVVIVDYENRLGYFKTREYPVPGQLFFVCKDNKTYNILVNSFTKNKEIYYLDTEKGLYILRYL